MIIDCDRCALRGDACRDCVIGVLLSAPADGPAVADGTGTEHAGTEHTGTEHTGPEPAESEPAQDRGPSGAPRVQLDAPERRALEVLADLGMVPRLRLVAEAPRRSPHDRGTTRQDRDAG